MVNYESTNKPQPWPQPRGRALPAPGWRVSARRVISTSRGLPSRIASRLHRRHLTARALPGTGLPLGTAFAFVSCPLTGTPESDPDGIPPPPSRLGPEPDGHQHRSGPRNCASWRAPGKARLSKLVDRKLQMGGSEVLRGDRGRLEMRLWKPQAKSWKGFPQKRRLSL